MAFFLRRIMVPGILVVLVIGGYLAAPGLFGEDTAQAYFEDVTLASGLSDRGMTFGAAWGDFDADGLPDVYLANHLRKGRLLKNLGNGRFSDVTREMLPEEPLTADKHGAQWADFDNDGDLDLIVLRGGGRGVGAEDNLLYVNEGRTFVERAGALGLANPRSRTRMPMWVDADRDGRLDLFMGAFKRPDGQAPAAIFMRDDDGFVERGGAAPFGSQSATFCILAEVDRDQFADLVCRVYEVPRRTAQIFSTADYPLREVDPFPATHFDDVVAADLDGDSYLDLYLVRRSVAAPVVVGRRGSNEVFADVWVTNENVDQNLGFALTTSGEIEVTVFDAHPRDVLSPEQIRIGAGGLEPREKVFLLSEEVAGLGSVVSVPSSASVSIDLASSNDEWIFRVFGDADLIANDPEKHQQLTFRVASNEPVTGMRVIGQDDEAAPSPDRFFVNRGGDWSEESAMRGVNEPPIDAVNVVAGDFDNDMDVDLYLVASSVLANAENRLLLNRGDGTFQAVAGTGGASGGRRGVGESATTVDFDKDGFLDILVANGGSMDRSFGLPAKGGDYRLYRNIGNKNNWIEIDLEGVDSNRDGIGAFVYVSAGGKKQVRLQSGGVHYRGQNHQRLHFGLAGNTVIDEIEIHWPSGVVQRLSGIAANQVLTIKES